MSENNEKIYKVVLVGEAGVGKTCIMTRFTKDKFDDEYITSFTAQFLRKTLEFADGKRITFDIWDTAGQEKYRALAKVYYKSANAVILVYDITTPESFKVMKEYWYEQVKEVDTDNFIIAIAANKSDLYEERQVDDKEGEEFAKSIGAIFASTSAKNDSGINGLFDNIARKILDPTFDFEEEERKKKEEFERRKKKEESMQKKTNDLLHKNDKVEQTQSFKISTKTVKESEEKQKKKKCC